MNFTTKPIDCTFKVLHLAGCLVLELLHSHKFLTYSSYFGLHLTLMFNTFLIIIVLFHVFYINADIIYAVLGFLAKMYRSDR